MAKVSKSRAGLRFAGDDLDPAAVSAVLGASAASASRKGEKRLSPGGRTITAPTGIWCFNAAERTPADLDAQIAEIFARLTPDLERWRNLSQRYRADVFCGLFLADTNEGVELTPVTLAALAARNLTIGFDIYGP